MSFNTSVVQVSWIPFALTAVSPSFRFINFPDQPIIWREISIITAALRSDCQDKHAQFLRGERTLDALSVYCPLPCTGASFMWEFST